MDSNLDKNKLYEENKYIVDILVNKYRKLARLYNIDIMELEQEAYCAFSDALNSYDSKKNAKLATFINLVIDRRLAKVIKKNSTEKSKFLKSVFSLDYDYEDGTTLKEIISDNKSNDPLNNLTNAEEFTELTNKIKSSLSTYEYEVFTYMVKGIDYQTIANITNHNPKQVDNTMQRIKHKIRDIIEG